MDYSDLTSAQLTDTASVLSQVDLLLEYDLPPNFDELLSEYLAMEPDERAALQSGMHAKAVFRAYAEASGTPEMADALMEMADAMKGMSVKELSAIKTGGISKLRG